MIIPLPRTKFWVLANDTFHQEEWTRRESIMVQDGIHAAAAPLLRRGDVVFDVGAFVGDTARWFLDQGCRVVAFEPFVDAFRCLVANCPEASCWNVAVGNGDMVDVVGTPFCEGDLGTRRVVAGSGQRTLRLDDFGVERVRLLKIDVEGHECSVLDGAEAVIREHKPYLLVEAFDSMLMLNGYTRGDLLDRIEALGYSWEVVVGEAFHDRCDFLARPL